MKQNEIHAVHENPRRRFFFAVEPPCDGYGGRMQEICELGYATDKFASLMERYRLHGGSVPRCYRTVEEGSGALHTRDKQFAYPSCWPVQLTSSRGPPAKLEA